MNHIMNKFLFLLASFLMMSASVEASCSQSSLVGVWKDFIQVNPHDGSTILGRCIFNVDKLGVVSASSSSCAFLNSEGEVASVNVLAGSQFTISSTCRVTSTIYTEGPSINMVDGQLSRDKQAFESMSIDGSGNLLRHSALKQ